MRAERICTAASDTRIFCACAPVFFCGHARAPPRAFASKAHSTSADRTGATTSVRLRVRVHRRARCAARHIPRQPTKRGATTSVRLHRRARLPARHILRQPTERGATTSVRLRVRVHRRARCAARHIPRQPTKRGATTSVRLHRRARLPARHILRQPTERGATTSVRLRVRVHRLPSTAAATADDCTSCPRAGRQAQIRRACAVRRLLQHRGMCLLQHMQDRGIMRAPRVTLSNVFA